MRKKNDCKKLADRLIKRRERENGRKDTIAAMEDILAGNTRYSVTPKGILYLAVHKFFSGGEDRIDDFSGYLLKELSLLVTSGNEPGVFGTDFNNFIKLFVDTLNLCGKMKEKLDENGIDFDFDED